MNNELYHYGVKGMRWGVRKKTSNVKKKKVRTKKQKALIAVGYTAAGLAISVIGAKVATNPKVVGLARRGMDAISNSKNDIDFNSMGPVIINKFGEVVDVDI